MDGACAWPGGVGSARAAGAFSMTADFLDQMAAGSRQRADAAKRACPDADLLARALASPLPPRLRRHAAGFDLILPPQGVEAMIPTHETNGFLILILTVAMGAVTMQSSRKRP